MGEGAFWLRKRYSPIEGVAARGHGCNTFNRDAETLRKSRETLRYTQGDRATGIVMLNAVKHLSGVGDGRETPAG
jgi:hypothetical protein